MFWFFSIPVKKLENVGVLIECKDWNIYKMALITGSDKVNDKECNTVRKVLKNSIEKS
jgi:succinate dehydrogenase flavin-adding protein (antitoxin of CptAB toxin-antitoxin module)